MARGNKKTGDSEGTSTTNGTDDAIAKQIGIRTGVTVPVERQIIDQDGLEDPETFLTSAKSPNVAAEEASSSSSKDVDNRNIPFKEQQQHRPKKTIVFQVIDNNNNKSSNDDDIKKDNDVFQDVAQKLKRTINPGRRTSFDTLDLSIVSTAAPSTVDTSKDKTISTSIDDDGVDAVVNSSNENKLDIAIVGTIQEEEPIGVDNTTMHMKLDDNSLLPPLLTQDMDTNTPTDEFMEPIEAVFGQKITSNIFSPDAPVAATNLPDSTEEDDLIPPPPPPQASTMDDDNEDDADEVDIDIGRDESVMATPTPSKKSISEKMTSASKSRDDDKYDVDMDVFDDDNKEGENFDIIHSFSADDEDKNNNSKTAKAKRSAAGLDDDLEDTDDEDVDKSISSKKSRNVRFDEASVTKSVKSRKEQDDRKSKLKVSGKRKEAQEDSDDNVMTIKVKKKKVNNNPYATVFESHGIPQQRTFTSIAVSDLTGQVSTPSSKEKNLRRSNRVRIRPLEFWRGEHLEYGPNDFGEEYDGVTNMSVPVYIHRADPTPYKQRKNAPRVVSNSKSINDSTKKKKNGSNDMMNSPSSSRQGSTPSASLTPFDDSQLRKKYEFTDNGVAHVWDQVSSISKDTTVVARSNGFKFKDLPMVRTRKSGEGAIVGKAAQAFYVSNKNNSTYPGYIMGKLLLPKRGIKDAETVGACAQTFTVLSCQPNSLELAYADPTTSSSNKRMMNLSSSTSVATRFLLGPGDVFCIPPGNCYRLQNHSKTTECMMSWTIIRPVQPNEE